MKEMFSRDVNCLKNYFNDKKSLSFVACVYCENVLEFEKVSKQSVRLFDKHEQIF